ncbi:CsbD family protein [Granulicella sp. S190]|uniref:CsbD family protein n=1 Tax=Granulicella sp. S190 TaxID=1747226 RepID=UPI00131D39C1|nr:CsbD family protein [Granulicella sp. S190]
MKGFPWILAGIGIGVAVTYVLFFSEPEPAYDTSYDGFSDAARKTFAWGTKQKAKGKVGSFAGAVKEGVGNLTGNQDLADEGTADRVEGKVKDVAGQVGQAVGQTIHDLNK